MRTSADECGRVRTNADECGRVRTKAGGGRMRTKADFGPVMGPNDQKPFFLLLVREAKNEGKKFCDILM